MSYLIALAQAAAPIHTAELNGWQFGLLVTPMILSFLTATVAAIVGVINSGRISQQTVAAKVQSEKIQEVHLLFNSRFTELLALTAKSSHAEGVVEGTKNQIIAAALAADPTGSIAAANARAIRGADATAAREIRVADAASATSSVSQAPPVPVTIVPAADPLPVSVQLGPPIPKPYIEGKNP